MPVHVPHESVIYVAPASQHGVLLAVVIGVLALAGATFAYAVSSARTSESAKPTPSGPPPAPPERSDRPSVKLGTPVVEAGEPIDDADQVIGAMSAGILGCYDQELRTNRTLRGDFSLKFKVTPSSTEARVRSSELAVRRASLHVPRLETIQGARGRQPSRFSSLPLARHRGGAAPCTGKSAQLRTRVARRTRRPPCAASKS